MRTSLRLAAASSWRQDLWLLLGAAAPRRGRGAGRGIHKIRHVVIIMQENRSFDSFFGTFPGADGIPMRNGVPTVCVPDPYSAHLRAAVPHVGRPRRLGGPHDHIDAVADIDGGKMDGFIRQAHKGRRLACVASIDAPACSLAPLDAASVMGYHDAREIPNYWAWAKSFVLQDHLFESDTSWSLPGAPVHGLRLVGALREEGRPDELPAGRAGAGLAAGLAAEPDERRAPTTHGRI